MPFQKCLHAKDQDELYYDLYNDRKCENGSKLHTYCIHKTVLETQTYIQYLPRYDRSALTRLCCGSLPLRVEVGRYNKEPLHTRSCILCSSNEIENEIHF